MSKLVDSLAALCAFLSIWLAVLYHFTGFEIINEYHLMMVTLFPIIVLLSLGIYSAFIVLWRVFNFNDCNKEALDLQTEIQEARADLIVKGFVFQ